MAAEHGRFQRRFAEFACRRLGVDTVGISRRFGFGRWPDDGGMHRWRPRRGGARVAAAQPGILRFGWTGLAEKSVRKGRGEIEEGSGKRRGRTSGTSTGHGGRCRKQAAVVRFPDKLRDERGVEGAVRKCRAGGQGLKPWDRHNRDRSSPAHCPDGPPRPRRGRRWKSIG